MQPLYTEAEFKAAKCRQPLPLCCLHCTKTFFKAKNLILLDMSPLRNRKTFGFCSHRCYSEHSRTSISVSCQKCGKTFNKDPQRIAKTKHNFCSRSCAAKWNNVHKTKGTRVSKLEKWLQVKLPELYPDLEFHFNRTDAINGELDIFIPSLCLAFELNGIFHYEPIYGSEKLAKMQNNDARKAQACYEHGIELCLIDISTQKYFKEQSSMKFLAIIQNITDSKLSGSSPVAKTA